MAGWLCVRSPEQAERLDVEPPDVSGLVGPGVVTSTHCSGGAVCGPESPGAVAAEPVEAGR